jgi:hypothetical protein
MRLLETTKVWTGDGLGAQAAVTLTQLKRTPVEGAPFPAALYRRTQKNGQPGGYEVFIIKVVKAGTPLPGGGMVEESYEQYPTANRFGKIAWAPGGLNRATEIYENLVKGLKPCDEADDVPGENNDEPLTEPAVTRVPGQRGRAKGIRPQLTVPVMEFSVKELAVANKVDYPIAFTFIKEAIEGNTIKLVRTERRAARGKETNIYAKV